MTLKEFLFAFIDYSRTNENALWNETVDQFLEEHHKEYYPVFIVKKKGYQSEALERQEENFKHCLNEEKQ